MPIVRIENEVESLPFGAGLNKFGNIRKGIRNETTGAMTDLRYFRSTFYPEYALLTEAFDELYGKQPEILAPLFLIGDTAIEAFDYWFEEHTKTKIIHQCDGEIQSKHFDKIQGVTSFESTACAAKGDGCGCKPTARFHVILPEFCRLVSRIGFFTVHTTSIYDIMSLRRYLKDIETLNGGKVSGIPLILGRAEREISVPNTKKGVGERMRLKKSLLYLSPTEGYVSNVLLPAYTDRPYALANGESGKLDAETGEVYDTPALPATVPDEDILVIDPPHPEREWDTEWVSDKTSSMFERGPNHQENTITKMIADGELTDDMDNSAAVAAISANRHRRIQEKIDAADKKADDPAQWASDNKAVAAFLKGAKDKFKFNTKQVLDALSAITPAPLENVSEFTGTKQDAWAACIAAALQYDSNRLEAFFPGDENSEMRAAVMAIIAKSEIAF